MFSPIGRNIDVIWVTSYQEFVDYIMIHGLPDGICFDHDLADEVLNGYDCAKWLVKYCINTKQQLPKISSQSANPIGRQNILLLLNNFKKHFNYESKKD